MTFIFDILFSEFSCLLVSISLEREVELAVKEMPSTERIFVVFKETLKITPANIGFPGRTHDLWKFLVGTNRIALPNGPFHLVSNSHPTKRFKHKLKTESMQKV